LRFLSRGHWRNITGGRKFLNFLVWTNLRTTSGAFLL
jgi:hypothetical protein